MAVDAHSLSSPRLRRLSEGRRDPPPGATEVEPCELCGAPLPGEHRHLLDLRTRQLKCACRACSLLFDRRGAGGGHYRLVGDRRLVLEGFVLDEPTWARLQIPVDMAFFVADSQARRTQAFYPSPMGATESRLELATWEEVRRLNPVLATMDDDVEALLVNRARGAQRHWLVPIDDCFRLVAVIRTRWRGFTGGRDAWSAIDAFFADLDARARPSDPPRIRPRS